MPELNTLGYFFEEPGHKITLEPPVADVDLDGWEVTIKSGAPYTTGYSGGPLNMKAGDGSTDANGGVIVLQGGATAGTGTGGHVTLRGGGGVDGSGGDVRLIAGVSENASRGNILFIFSGGNTIMSGLPTADPLVAGALYSNGVPSAGVPKALMISGG